MSSQVDTFVTTDGEKLTTVTQHVQRQGQHCRRIICPRCGEIFGMAFTDFQVERDWNRHECHPNQVSTAPEAVRQAAAQAAGEAVAQIFALLAAGTPAAERGAAREAAAATATRVFAETLTSAASPSGKPGPGRPAIGSPLQIRLDSQALTQVAALADEAKTSRPEMIRRLVDDGLRARSREARIKEISKQLPRSDHIRQLVKALATASSAALVRDEAGVRLADRDDPGAVIMSADDLALHAGQLALEPWAYEPGGDERAEQMVRWIRGNQELLADSFGPAECASVAMAYACQLGPTAVQAMAWVMCTYGY